MTPPTISPEPDSISVSVSDPGTISLIVIERKSTCTEAQHPFSYTRSPSPPLNHPPTTTLAESEPKPEPKPTLSVSIPTTKIQEKDDPDLITPAPPLSSQPQHDEETEDYDPCLNAKPYSPFYRHATPSSKLARLTSSSQRKRSKSLVMKSPIDEIEGVSRPPWHRLFDDDKDTDNDPEALRNRDTHVHIPENESKLWAQKKRYCDCLAGLSKGRRLLIKGAIAVVIVGSMVAVALGITAAVGGGVWSGDHQSEVLPIRK